jgi:AmpD protein
MEGTDDIPYETVQYQALSRLVGALREYYPAMAPDAMVGHSEIAPGRKTDPGTAFDWQILRQYLSEAM